MVDESNKIEHSFALLCALQVDLSPALLARLILEHHLILADPHGEPRK